MKSANYLCIMVFLLLFTTIGNVTAAGNKVDNLINITFHVEAGHKGSKKTIIKQQTPLGAKYFYRSAVLNYQDVEAFKVFKSPYQQGNYGLVLQISKKAQRKLNQAVAFNRDKYGAFVMNGLLADMVKLNNTVKDQRVVIWRNIPYHALQVLDQQFPRIGETKLAWRKRIKQRKKQLKEKAKIVKKKRQL